VSDDPRPEELLRIWRASAVPVEPRSELERERGIEVVRATMAKEAARRATRRRVFGLGALAAAAALVIGFGVASWKLGVDMGERSAAVSQSTELSISGGQGGVVLDRGGKRALLEQQRPASLAAGDRLETLADGRVELRSDHSRWQLGRSTRVELVGAGRTGERLRVALGKVDVDVTPSKERKVVVETPHAEVLVVGTAFSVQVQGDGAQAETSVEVTRGTVWVVQGEKRQAVLEAGQRWSSRAEQSAAVPTASVEPAPRSVPISSAQQGTLDEENKLMRAAFDARNRGDNAAAAKLFGELLQRFPRSVISQDASVSRLRALVSLGRTKEAKDEARRYLRRFPRGAARDEAQRVLDDSR